MGRIVVAYATNTGTTADVAQVIGEELQNGGGQVDVLEQEQVSSLEAYDGMILAAPMIMGWHRGAVGFLKQKQEILSRIRLHFS